VHGRILQLTGQARIIWDTELGKQMVGAERLVEFHLGRAIETSDVTLLRWRLMEHSPHNPA